MKILGKLLILCLVVSCSMTPPQKNDKYPDMHFESVITNALVLMPDMTTQKSTIFLSEGKIIHVEKENYKNSAMLEGLLSTNNSIEVIDAQDNFVMPGLIDAHAHFIALGESKANLDFLGTESWDEIVEMVKNKATKTPKGQWIVGRGWHQEKWKTLPEKLVEGFPVHDELSQVAADHPVMLGHASGHGLIANQKAMDLAGITPQSQIPDGGVMLLKPDGKPSGIFQENAMQLIYTAIENSKKDLSTTEKENLFMEYLRLAEAECLSQGITTVHDAGIDWNTAQKFLKLADDNELNVRLYAMMSDKMLQNTDKTQLKNHIEKTRNHPFFTNTAVKAFADGALGSRGAWLLEDYSDMPGYRGENVTPIENLKKSAQMSAELNLQLCIHAIGDRGNREVIDIFEEIYPNELGAKRWRIEHAQHLNPKDIERIAHLEILASMQTVHCTSDAPYVVRRLGEKRAEQGAYVWQSLLKKNVHLANGTDAPIEKINPFENLYAAVTRKRIDTGLEFYPNQKLSRKKALQMYTQDNAYAAFQENWKGKIAKGFAADIIILDKNLLECSDEEILDTKVLFTLVNGKVKYRSK
ncbi:MAG: amidohydrolase [Flavobacteriaceae bacterium]|nr:amidohydrolase [Flavobacteriaceae bacterium]